LKTFDASVPQQEAVALDDVLEDDTVSIMHAFQRAFSVSYPGGRIPTYFDDYGIPHHRLVRLLKIIAELRRCNYDYTGVPNDLRKAIVNITGLLTHLADAIALSDRDLARLADTVHHPRMRCGSMADCAQEATAKTFRSMLSSIFVEQRIALEKCKDTLQKLTSSPEGLRLCHLVPCATSEVLAVAAKVVVKNDSDYGEGYEPDSVEGVDSGAEGEGVDSGGAEEEGVESGAEYPAAEGDEESVVDAPDDL